MIVFFIENHKGVDKKLRLFVDQFASVGTKTLQHGTGTLLTVNSLYKHCTKRDCRQVTGYSTCYCYKRYSTRQARYNLQHVVNFKHVTSTLHHMANRNRSKKTTFYK